jgi:hypothetical protein
MKVKTMVYNLEGKLQYYHTEIVTARPSLATDAGEIAFPQNLSAVHFVKLQLLDASDRLVSDNFYWRATPEHEDDFRALNTLPMATVDIQAKRYDAGRECVLDVELRNPSRSIALMTHLQLRTNRSAKRVLPVFYSDNYVSLLPGESKSLTIEAAAADLGGEAPLLAVDGWNVTVNPAASSSKTVRVIANLDAQIADQVAVTVSGEPADIVRINCGGSQLGFFRFGPPPPPEEFTGDRDYSGGDAVATKNSIDTGVSNAAPAAIYQTERRGPCRYIIAVKKGLAYTVRLHFAETRFSAGGRKFNVDINGQQILGDFDIASEAGKDKALVKDFSSISPDESGRITIALSRGSAEQPIISGIEILK